MTLSKKDRKRIVIVLKNRGFKNPQKMSTDRLFKKYESSHTNRKRQTEKNREKRIRKKI